MTATVEQLRDRLAQSPIAHNGGWLVTSLLDEASLSLLHAEAVARREAAETYFVREDDGEENRGGAPDRWLDSAPGGPMLAALSQSSAVAALLTRMTLLMWTPSGGGTYSYYCRAGHHLGIHRDVEECDLAVLVCVEDGGFDATSPAGTLCVYPSRRTERLSSIRAQPDRGARYIRTRPGEAAILLGGIVPHRVIPLGPDHTRIIAPLCFTATGDGQ